MSTKKTKTEPVPNPEASGRDEKVAIPAYVKARQLPLYMANIMENYCATKEGVGFPKTEKRTIAEWDAMYQKMNSEKV